MSLSDEASVRAIVEQLSEKELAAYMRRDEFLEHLELTRNHQLDYEPGTIEEILYAPEEWELHVDENYYLEWKRKERSLMFVPGYRLRLIG